MVNRIPSAAEAQKALASLTHSQLLDLVEVSGVSFTTLWSIRSGARKNPGVDTVGKFLAHLPRATKKTHGGA